MTTHSKDASAGRALAISGATVIDGTGRAPLKDGVIVIKGDRVVAIGGRDTPIPPGTPRMDATGKYIIPGLMNANVHLSLGMLTVERSARHLHQYEGITVEAAQVALKNGLTTVFDTCGIRRPLMSVRDKINAGEVIGSRIFCAGWIIGFDGLFSADFQAKAAEVLSSTFVRRIEALCVENVGRHLMWLPPEQVAREVQSYIEKGIDFIKFAANEHYAASGGAFLAFSPRVQQAMVDVAHRSGVTAQAHTMSVEGLQIATEAGCDLIQHANITGPVPIPQETLDLMAKKGTGAVIFPWTRRGLDWIMNNVTDMQRTMWQASDQNAENFIRAGVPLLLANDGMVLPPEFRNEPRWAKSWSNSPVEENLAPLATGHFVWLRAMEEKGCPPMEILKAATRNIAVAYGKDRDLGTLETGKIADLIVLDKDPLLAADNYRSITAIVKEGALVDRDSLPLQPILTVADAPIEEEQSYIPAIGSAGASFPMCPMCMFH